MKKKETWNIEEFMEDLESHIWAQDEHSNDYQNGFSEAIEQIQNWIETHKQILEAPNGAVVSFVETRDKY